MLDLFYFFFLLCSQRPLELCIAFLSPLPDVRTLSNSLCTYVAPTVILINECFIVVHLICAALLIAILL